MRVVIFVIIDFRVESTFKYYFQNIRECYCGDDPYQYGPEDVDDQYIKDYDCNANCSGDSEQICGGWWRLSVYETGNETE